MLFYTQLFTSKRGPLAKIWLAAHWERKITKAHVFECNLENTIKDIISPEIKIGLRTSGHLLLGVVRIYSRKAKYLLSDCSDALCKIKVAFRPGQTDMPFERLEASLKAITLIEEFTDFETQLPQPSNIEVVDHFSLNQCPSAEITLKEDFTHSFLPLADFGDESQQQGSGLLDMSFQSLAHHGDAFGDEDKEFTMLDFMTSFSDQNELTDLVPEPRTPPMPIQQDDATTSEPMRVELSTPDETTLLADKKEGFVLEPLDVPPLTVKRKRKRRLVVDRTKELSNEAITQQLASYSDLVTCVDMAPPTHQLMHWKEKGGVDTLFGTLCVSVISAQIQQHLKKYVFRFTTGDDVSIEEMRHEREEVLTDPTELTTEDPNITNDLLELGMTRDNTGLSNLEPVEDHLPENDLNAATDVSRSELSYPDLPSDNSMFVHQSGQGRESQLTDIRTQSMLDSEDLEDKVVNVRTQKLLHYLKSQSSDGHATVSLGAMCEGSSRSQVATTFFSLLVLKKCQAVNLRQDRPYSDITVSPGPTFHDS